MAIELRGRHCIVGTVVSRSAAFVRRDRVGDLAPSLTIQRITISLCCGRPGWFRSPGRTRASFPPSVEGWAVIGVLSINTSAGGPPAAASITDRSCQTPWPPIARSACRASSSVRSRGRINPSAPGLTTWMIPLITRRSSTRATPRALFGSSSPSRSKCPRSPKLAHIRAPATAEPESHSGRYGNPVYGS